MDFEMGWRDGEAGRMDEGWNWDKDRKEAGDRLKTSGKVEIRWGGREGNRMGLWRESDRTMEIGLGLDTSSGMGLKMRLGKEVGQRSDTMQEGMVISEGRVWRRRWS